jgi:hypothetical protein
MLWFLLMAWVGAKHLVTCNKMTRDVCVCVVIRQRLGMEFVGSVGIKILRYLDCGQVWSL